MSISGAYDCFELFTVLDFFTGSASMILSGDHFTGSQFESDCRMSELATVSLRREFARSVGLVKTNALGLQSRVYRRVTIGS